MKFNRLSAFLVGVVTTAASVGAVSYVDASGSSTIQACADKRTGVMRLISRGSCKRTETLVSWNRVGPQGATGPQGLPGATGEKGSTGATGPAGSNASVETVTWNFPYLTTSWGNCPLAFLGDGPTPVGYLVSNPSSAYGSNNATPIYSCTARIKAVK
jgi:hypothetical protein